MSERDFLGEFEHLVMLAIARLQPDGYGTTLREEIEKRTGRVVSVGALYATLDRMDRKGWIRSREGEPTPERGGRAKRHYVLAAAGVQALEASRARLDAMWQGADVRARRA